MALGVLHRSRSTRKELRLLGFLLSLGLSHGVTPVPALWRYPLPAWDHGQCRGLPTSGRPPSAAVLTACPRCPEPERKPPSCSESLGSSGKRGHAQERARGLADGPLSRVWPGAGRHVAGFVYRDFSVKTERSVASRARGTGHCVRAVKGCRRLLGLETGLRWPVQLAACIWGRARATGGTLHTVMSQQSSCAC